MTRTGALVVKQVGRVRLVCFDGKEEHEFSIYPLPELSVSGLLAMSIFVECLGKTRIVADDGSVGEIEFVPVGIVFGNQGWFTGEYFTVKGFVKGSEDSQPYCTIDGLWTEASYVRKGAVWLK